MSKFKVGDRVRVLRDRASSADVRRGEQGSVEEKHGGSVVVRMDDGRDWWLDGEPGREIELVEDPNPFKNGDRVRVLTGFAKDRYGKVVTSYSNNGVSVVLDGTCGQSLYYAVDSVQYAPDQTFVLARGDRIVNNLTGRKGHVVEGQDEDLWVVDETHSEETGAKAAAVEEYEAHYPNTYEITKKGPF